MDAGDWRVGISRRPSIARNSPTKFPIDVPCTIHLPLGGDINGTAIFTARALLTGILARTHNTLTPGHPADRRFAPTDDSRIDMFAGTPGMDSAGGAMRTGIVTSGGDVLQERRSPLCGWGGDPARRRLQPVDRPRHTVAPGKAGYFGHASMVRIALSSLRHESAHGSVVGFQRERSLRRFACGRGPRLPTDAPRFT